MQAEFAVPLSIYAAIEASDAAQKADRAERQAFVNGYSHATATSGDRERYIESVRMLYPQQDRAGIDPRPAIKGVGFVIVSLFLACVIGGVVGKVFRDDIEDGIFQGLAVWLACAAGALAIFIVVAGFYLLFFA